VSFERLNSALGLKSMGDNEKLYKKFLIDFIKVNKNEVKQLDVLLNSDRVAFKRKVHTIKGQAGTIGAIKLQELANKLETSITRENLSAFSQEFWLLIEEMENNAYLSEMDKQIDTDKNRVSIDIINQLFEELEMLLNTSKPVLINERMQQLLSYELSEKDQKLLTEIEALVKRYQFKNAYQVIQIRRSSFF